MKKKHESRTLTRTLCDHVGEMVFLRGWVHRCRDLGGVYFLLLRDRSGLCQIVFEKTPVDEEGNAITIESVIDVTGRVVANPKSQGGFELHADIFKVQSRANPDLPVTVNQDPSHHSLETLLEHRIISLRNPKTLSIFRLQAEILRLFAEHFRVEGFTEIKSSKLIGSGTEGGTGLFAVDYFDRKVYLAQSPQLYKQAMVASGLERVFEIGMAYRAEKHDTPRHINEYVSLDVEIAFIETEHDLMDLEQRFLKTLFLGIEQECGEILDQWNAKVPSSSAVNGIPRLSYDEALSVIANVSGNKVYDINPEGERTLCEWANGEHGIEAAFIYSYPRRKRPFYTYPAENNKTMSFDLLFRGQEITSGGRRINNYLSLVQNLKRFGIDSTAMSDYLSIFKFGCPPHGGFAIGLERLTQAILRLDSVKQATLFPRDRKRVRP